MSPLKTFSKETEFNNYGGCNSVRDRGQGNQLVGYSQTFITKNISMNLGYNQNQLL